MRILFLCRFLPHPQVRDSGGQDTYHYIATLSEHHRVSLIAFVGNMHSAEADSMRSVCEDVIEVPYKPQALLSRLWRQWWRILLPQVYGRNISLRYWRLLRATLAQKDFDAVFVDGMMAVYGKRIDGALRILDEVDVYSVVAYQGSKGRRSKALRAWHLWDSLRTLAWELHYVDSYDAVLVRSEKDREFLRSFVPDQRISVIQPWFEGLGRLQEVSLRRPSGNRLLFVGAMSLPANVEAVVYFVQEVLPLIREQVEDAELCIVGSTPDRSVKRLAAQDGVVVTGEVPDLKPFHESCAAVVVPLLRGGGVIVKTLNGMAAGRPTVTTPAGNSGTGADPGRHLLVASRRPQAFADAVVRVLVDQRLWQELADSGRRYVSANYSWERTEQQLQRLLRQAAEAGGEGD